MQKWHFKCCHVKDNLLLHFPSCSKQPVGHLRSPGHVPKHGPSKQSDCTSSTSSFPSWHLSSHRTAVVQETIYCLSTPSPLMCIPKCRSHSSRQATVSGSASRPATVAAAAGSLPTCCCCVCQSSTCPGRLLAGWCFAVHSGWGAPPAVHVWMATQIISASATAADRQSHEANL